MINNYSDLRYYLKSDSYSVGVRFNLRNLIFEPVIRFTFVMRLYEYFLNTKKPYILLLPIKFYFKILSVRLGFSLGPNIFGPGVAIIHYGLLVIDPTTRIGKNCRVHMGVHIGGAATFVESGTEHLYSPRIGDNVYLGPGSKIYGPVKIANNSVVGANSVVTKSFEDEGVTIAGVPAKVIARGSTGERVIKGTDKI